MPVVPQGRRIPRLIHQTYPTRNVPDEIGRSIENIKRANPDWHHCLYDDDDVAQFIRSNYGPRMLEYFERINPNYGAARADLFRYLLVYLKGGFYLDIKSSLSRPLDEALRPDDAYVLSHWKNPPGKHWGVWPELPKSIPGEFQNWHIAAVPGHPLLRAVILQVLENIDRYNPWIQGTGKLGVLRTTGPIAYTLAILPGLAQHEHRVVSCNDELGFEYSIYGRSDVATHAKLFRSHYLRLDEPIIRLGLAGHLRAAYARPKPAIRYVLNYCKRRFSWPRSLRDDSTASK